MRFCEQHYLDVSISTVFPSSSNHKSVSIRGYQKQLLAFINPSQRSRVGVGGSKGNKSTETGWNDVREIVVNVQMVKTYVAMASAGSE